MPRFPSLPEPPTLGDVFKRFPAGVRPLLQYHDADAEAVFAAGWNEEALFHAISVTALFNFMNRIVKGSGVQSDESVRAEQRQRHEALKDDPSPYQSFGDRIGLG